MNLSKRTQDPSMQHRRFLRAAANPPIPVSGIRCQKHAPILLRRLMACRVVQIAHLRVHDVYNPRIRLGPSRGARMG